MYVDIYGREHRYGPPAGWVPPQGQQHLGERTWSELCERGLDLPNVAGPGKVFYLNATGDCLHPLIQEERGDVFIVRPLGADEPLVHGGLYVMEWLNKDDVDQYQARTGKRCDVIAKFLYYLGHEWWYLCKDGVARLDARVLGTVIGLTTLAACSQPPPCQPNPFDASQLASCRNAQISANAVSQILSSTWATFGTSISTGSPISNQIFSSVDVAITTTGSPVAIDFSSGQMAFQTSGAVTAWNVTFGIYRDNSSTLVYTGPVYDSTRNGTGTGVWINISPLMFTLVDSGASAGVHTYYLGIVSGSSTGGTGLNLTLNNAIMKLREVKR